MTKHAHNRKDIPVEELLSKYTSGESVFSLANHYGVNRHTIMRRLRENSVDARSFSEAQKERYRRTDEAERQRMTKAAHDATRGSRKSIEDLQKRARSIEKRRPNVSASEILIADLLKQRGISFMQQKAINKYNIDFVIDDVVLEIYGGFWHFTGRHAERFPERIRVIRESGYRFLAIYTDKRKGFDITERTIDLIQEFIKSDIKHLVVRADGEVYSKE